jgi:hypothetical protein
MLLLTTGTPSVVVLALHTRRQSQIANELCNVPPRAGDQIYVNDLMVRYDRAIHRTKVPDRKYNCHGLTFATRRSSIVDPAEVQKILNDDGYQLVVEPNPVLPGDVALYRADGDIEHTGIVVRADAKCIWILSKWSCAQEVIHEPHYCPYKGVVSYFRIKP